MLVSTAIFSVVMILAIGSLLTMIDGNNKAQALKLAMNNINFALEGMSRTIRIGTQYRCSNAGGIVPNKPPSSQIQNPNDCDTGGRLIAFEKFGGNPSDPDDQFVYRFVVDSAVSTNARGWIERCTQNCHNSGGGSYIPITAPEVDIEELTFYVTGTEPSTDEEQPKVVITIRGTVGEKDKIKTSFNIQTTVSQRILDLP